MMGILIFLGIIVAFIIICIALYNSIVKLRVRVSNAWSQIDIQLKRRHDLIPNLVETVKGYAEHEKETLENVIKARTQASEASDIKERAQAENVLTGALRQLFAVVENYPTIKANQNFLNLQEELTTTENRIAFARQYYNDEVMRFNTAIQTVPQNIIAQQFDFNKSEFIEIEDPRETKVPRVKF